MSLASNGRVDLPVVDGRVIVKRGPAFPMVTLELLGPRRGPRGELSLYTPMHAAWALRQLVHGASVHYVIDGDPHHALVLDLEMVLLKGQGPAPGAKVSVHERRTFRGRLGRLGRCRGAVLVNRDMVFDLAGLIEATERSWG